MSIDVEAKVLVGCKFDSLFTDEGEFWEAVEKDQWLEYASPWYDSETDFWIVGYSVTGKMLERGGMIIETMRDSFEVKYSIASSIFITPHVS